MDAREYRPGRRLEPGRVLGRRQVLDLVGAAVIVGEPLEGAGGRELDDRLERLLRQREAEVAHPSSATWSRMSRRLCRSSSSRATTAPYADTSHNSSIASW